MLEITSTRNIQREIQTVGYSIVSADEINLAKRMCDAWNKLREDYSFLEPDEFLPDGGKYRFRRYDSFCFLPHTGELSLLPHVDYFQSKDVNQVTGGIVRQFARLSQETITNPFLGELLRFDFAQFPIQSPEQCNNSWQVDIHEILVKTEPKGEGHPTPEGVHRDGAEFVTVHLAILDNAEGGEVTIYDDDKQGLKSFRLKNVLDSYLFNDARLWHGASAIRSADGRTPAQRGILSFDFHYKPELLPID